MSHFTVLVVGDDIDKELEPFEESPKDKKYLKFVVADESSEELRAEYEEKKEEYNYESFEEFLEDYYEYEINEAGEAGEAGSWRNPNAQWDWYTCGGRWKDYFVLKNGLRVDRARKGDVDFERMRDERVANRLEKYDQFWDLVDGRDFKYWDELLTEFEGDGGKTREAYWNQDVLKDIRESDDFSLDKIEEYDGDRDDFAKRERTDAISTFATLKNGKWSERGKMGWWACVSNEKEDWTTEFNDFVDALDDNEILNLVDCHI